MSEVLVELSIKCRSKIEISEKPIEISYDEKGKFITTKVVYYHAKEEGDNDMKDTE